MSNLVVLAACLALVSRIGFISTAPLNEGTTGESTSSKDEAVKELEDLKQSLGRTLALMKSHSFVYTNINGENEEHSETTEEVKENGNLVAKVIQQVDTEPKVDNGKPLTKVRTDVEVPSQGIHKSVVQKLAPDYQALTQNGNRRSSNLDTLQESANSVERSGGYSGTRYSPLDMAEYVFWTGDEKGVSLAIEEFLQEGLMTREEAISFLQEIKYNLEYLKSHYIQLGVNSREQHSTKGSLPTYSNFDKDISSRAPELRNKFDISLLRQGVNKKRNTFSAFAPPVPAQTQSKTTESEKIEDEDYEELLEKLRVADFLYTEYSLEEVIYQLAKVMFTQSLTRGSAEAQQALQKFTNFLEKEAEQGHISRSLEKKVLDVLIASLSDTLTEHPELLPNTKQNLNSPHDSVEDQHYLRQILDLTPEDKIAMQAVLAPYKDQLDRNSHLDEEQMKQAKLALHPVGLGKYKNP